MAPKWRQNGAKMAPYGAKMAPFKKLQKIAPFSVFAKWKMAVRHFYRHQRHLMAPSGAIWRNLMAPSGAIWRSWRHFRAIWRMFLSDTIALFCSPQANFFDYLACRKQKIWPEISIFMFFLDKFEFSWFFHGFHGWAPFSWFTMNPDAHSFRYVL